MILRREHLSGYPSVFRSLTGLAVTAFDQMLPGLLAAFGADRRRLDRPDRRRAFGGGDAFDLAPADQFLLTIVWLRQYPTQEALGYLFGASDSTALRAIRRCLPILEAQGQDAMRLPDPGKYQRKALPALLRDTPGLAVVVDTFEQRVQRPKRRQRAYYSGKKKAHTLKSQVTVDEDGQVVHVGDSRPGCWADLKVLKRSALKGGCPRGSGRWATWPTWASRTGTPRGWGRRRGASRAGGRGRRRTGATTAPSRGGDWWWNIPWRGCAATRRSRPWTGTAAGNTRHGSGRWPAWSTGCTPIRKAPPQARRGQEPLAD